MDTDRLSNTTSNSTSAGQHPADNVICISPDQLPANSNVIQLVSSPETSSLAVMDEVLDLTGSPTPQAAAQLNPQPASRAVGRRLLYELPPDWSASSGSDSDSPHKPEPVTKKAATASFRTWCGVRIVILALYLIVGNDRITHSGVSTPSIKFLSMHTIGNPLL